jgi:hypothetical protein
MAASPVTCVGHQSILRIKDINKKWSDKTVEPINQNLRLSFKTGPGNTREMNILDITEDFRPTNEFMMMSTGGTLPVPVLETRSMKMPSPNVRDQRKWPKEAALKTIDCEDMSRQPEDIWDDMVRHYKDMVDKGGSEVQARADIKKSSAWTKWNQYEDLRAEITGAESFQRALRGLPSFVIRSVKMLKKAIINMQRLGILTDLPKNDEGQPVFDWEADLMAAYVCDGKLRVVLGEVKRKNLSPWDTERTPDRQTVSKALNQLRTDLQFLQVNRCFHTCVC